MARIPGFAALPMILAGILASAVAAKADFTLPTLDRIAQTGKIRIGYGNTAPFSFTTDDGQVVGYSIDICRSLAQKLKTRLNLPALEIEFVPRTPSNRVQLLNDGSMDIECNASTNSADRRKTVNFAYSHFYSATRYVALKKSGLTLLDDLKGRSVSVALGTVNVSDITEINRSRKLNLSVVPVDSLQSAFDMVADGRVSAFAMDEVLLRMMIARTAKPEDYHLSTEVVADVQPLGFMMRLGDPEFTSAVNEALRDIYRSPQMQSIYHRWFEETIAPLGVNLRMPISEKLKSNFENPVSL